MRTWPKFLIATRSLVCLERFLAVFHGTCFVSSAMVKVPNYPCHTQAVERGVKLVSEASAAAIGQEAREGFICQRIKERKVLNKFESKKDYYPKVEAATSSMD